MEKKTKAVSKTKTEKDNTTPKVNSSAGKLPKKKNINVPATYGENGDRGRTGG